MCDVERNTDYFTERLLAEKEADLVRLSRLNEMLRMANVQLTEENRELKRRLEGKNGT